MGFFKQLKKFAETQPEHTVLEDAAGCLNYRQLLDCLISNQQLLLEKGYQPGTPVIVMAEKQLEFVLIFLSLLSIGCWVIPLPSDTGRVVIERISAMAGAVLIPNHLFFPGAPAVPEPGAELIEPDEEQTGILHMTSGTTDQPKLCVRSLRALAAEGKSYCTTFNSGPEDKLLSAAPLYHSYALGAGLIAGLSAGMTICTVDGFTPRKVLRLIDECKITFLILVPAMARALGSTFTTQAYNVASLRIALVGAGAITEEVYTCFKERFGIALLSNYGSTETGGIVSRLEPLPFASIGKPMNGVEIKLCDAQGAQVAAGVEGELKVRTASMFSGYYGLPAPPLDDEGFFSMCDLAVQDEAGYLYIKGRTKLMINVGGRKVNPYEVEGVLLTLPGVQECAVVGVTRPSGEEAVKAYIVADKHVTEMAIRNFCFEHLSRHKLPAFIELVPGLPRNPVGKVKREELMKGQRI